VSGSAPSSVRKPVFPASFRRPIQNQDQSQRRASQTIVSVFFMFSIVVTWYLGGKTAADRVALTPISWSLFVAQWRNARRATARWRRFLCT
jgi:hypothetical protein